ncbi:collagen-like triple helix repeat-containing protein [Cupriavidus pinatubonensis]|uniref:collagen-like triple helix repeat-containing protein n=1 Tax=Cupriavidus pinatubonensis TaxID=248026 RepID=UPI001129155E|nr:collagen-like triple helix repeat-containing protein [Cupriavidus pinatubonensis]TPQ37779.1 hemagglutinin [Cupriavidus pinatubonensis]
MNNNNRVQRPLASLAGICISALALLAGCASGGGGDSGLGPKGDGANPPPQQPPASASDSTPAAKVIESTGHTVMAAGNAVSDIGKQIQDAPIPLLPAQARYGAGGVVINAGETIGALGAAAHDGLGKMGSVYNPVGVTVTSTGNVVQEAGDTVTSAGQLISGVGTDRLSPLEPVTAPVGGAVQKVGMAVSYGGVKLGEALSAGPVAQLTEASSKAIVPLTTRLTDTTQTVRGATGLGMPVDGLLFRAGHNVAGGAGLLANSPAPAVSGLSGAVTETGRTVAVAGGLVHGTPSGGGNPLGGLLNTLPLASGGGKYGGPGGNECAPNLLVGLTLVAAVAGTPAQHGANSAGLLAPVLGPVAGLASAGTKYTTGEDGKGTPPARGLPR